MGDHTFSYSELEDLRQCAFKWQLGWLERWTPPQPHPKAARGTWWHQAMAAYHGCVMRHPERPPFRRIRRQLFPQPPQDAEDKLREWMLEGYFEQWGGDDQWERVAVEQKWEVPIAPGLRLKVKVDLIVRLFNSRRLWLVDAKTSENLPKTEELDLHPQFPLYTWAVRQAGRKIWGCIHDGVRTLRYKDPNKPQPLDERFRRTLIHHPDAFLETVRRDAARDMQQALLQRPVERDPNLRRDMPRHWDPDRCRHRCPFTDACLAGARGGNTREFLRDLGFTQQTERH